MRQKHKKNSSMGSPNKPRPIGLDKQILKRSMEEINQVHSLLGKHSIKWSFSKANRFSRKRPEESSEYVNLKSTIGTGRSAGFGYGKRWVPLNPKGKDAPPPTTYTVPSSINNKVIGGKFSPPRVKSAGRNRWSSPGPGTYEMKSCIGTAVSCTLKSRHSMMARHCSPPPGTYNPRHSLVESGRFSAISFGTKTSYDNFDRFTTPGPGSYDLGSTFSSISPSPVPKKRGVLRKNSL